MCYECIVCGWIYNEVRGSPEHNISPGTKFADLPYEFFCLECSAGVEAFEEYC
ncbi:MAG: rubredoxin [Francisellaceae bacterium]